MRDAHYIVVVTFQDKDDPMKRILVSHGIDSVTLKDIPLPPVTPHELGARYSSVLGEWILDAE